MAGLIVYAYYENCDPFLAKRIHAADQILPLFVMDTLSFIPGFAGLFISTVFSGSLRLVMLNSPKSAYGSLLYFCSTVSSGVNSLAAVVLEDLIKPYCSRITFFRDMSEERA